jgi:hypothetical protein
VRVGAGGEALDGARGGQDRQRGEGAEPERAAAEVGEGRRPDGRSAAVSGVAVASPYLVKASARREECRRRHSQKVLPLRRTAAAALSSRPANTRASSRLQKGDPQRVSGIPVSLWVVYDLAEGHHTEDRGQSGKCSAVDSTLLARANVFLRFNGLQQGLSYRNSREQCDAASREVPHVVKVLLYRSWPGVKSVPTSKFPVRSGHQVGMQNACIKSTQMRCCGLPPGREDLTTSRVDAQRFRPPADPPPIHASLLAVCARRQTNQAELHRKRIQERWPANTRAFAARPHTHDGPASLPTTTHTQLAGALGSLLQPLLPPLLQPPLQPPPQPNRYSRSPSSASAWSASSTLTPAALSSSPAAGDRESGATACWLWLRLQLQLS